MTSLFNGMASLASDILGGVVTVVPAVGASFTVQAIFREDPIEVLDGDGGGMLQMVPTLSAPKAVAALLSIGDEVQPDGARRFQIVNGQPNGSPADDAERVFELEEVFS